MEVTKKDVAELIEIRKRDSFLVHFWTSLWQDYRPKGEIGKDYIKVWRPNFWNRGFYPVFTFEFNDKGHLINITGRLNKSTRFFIYLLALIFTIGVFSKNPLEFDYVGHLRVIVVLLIFFFILVFLFRKLYLFEKQNQLDQILELLDVETEEKIPEREWSLKNILIRLFTYPFCLFLIGLTVFVVIPEKNFILAIGTLSMVSFYLAVDLRMVFRERKRKKHLKQKNRTL